MISRKLRIKEISHHDTTWSVTRLMVPSPIEVGHLVWKFRFHEFCDIITNSYKNH